MYSIDQIKYVEQPDGTFELLVSDESLLLVLDGLEEMGLSLPIKEDQWEIVEDYLDGLDIGIGSVEVDGIYPTTEYNENTGRAVDEFKFGYRGGVFIDYGKVNRRLAELLEQYGKDGKYTLHYERWLPKKEPKKVSKKGTKKK